MIFCLKLATVAYILSCSFCIHEVSFQMFTSDLVINQSLDPQYFPMYCTIVFRSQIKAYPKGPFVTENSKEKVKRNSPVILYDTI